MRLLITSSSSSRASWAWSTATSSESDRSTHFRARYRSNKTSLRTWWTRREVMEVTLVKWRWSRLHNEMILTWPFTLHTSVTTWPNLCDVLLFSCHRVSLNPLQLVPCSCCSLMTEPGLRSEPQPHLNRSSHFCFGSGGGQGFNEYLAGIES